MGAVLDLFKDAAQKLRLAMSMAGAKEVTIFLFAPTIGCFQWYCGVFQSIPAEN